MIGQRAVSLPPNQAIEVTARMGTLFKAATIRSLGTSATYVWDFGDGSGDTVADPPAKTYLNPGYYRLRLTVTTLAPVTTEIYDRVVRVGLDASQIPTVGFKTDCSFEAVVLTRLALGDGTAVLAAVPLLAASKPYAYAVDTDPTTPTPPVTADVAELTERLLQVYAQRALMLPAPEPEALAEGLYLLFPRDIVYAGQSYSISSLIQQLHYAFRESDLAESLFEQRPWAIANEVLDATNAHFTGNLEAAFDPTNGDGWLAPGLSSMQNYLSLDADVVQDTALTTTSLAAAQALLAPSNSLAREMALTWLLQVTGGFATEVRRFGEKRGPRVAAGERDFPACLVAWNTADATMAWSVLCKSQDAASAYVENYWIHGAATFGLGRAATEALVPTLDGLPRIRTAPGRHIADDATTRQELGEDRELSDHVIVEHGQKVSVRFRTGEVFSANGDHTTSADAGAHVIASVWSAVSKTLLTEKPPLYRMPALAQAITRGAPETEQNLVSSGIAPSSAPRSSLSLDTSNTVMRFRLRRGGEILAADRTQDAMSTVLVLTGTVGPYALGQTERTVNENAPLRNPLKMAVQGSV